MGMYGFSDKTLQGSMESMLHDANQLLMGDETKRTAMAAGIAAAIVYILFYTDSSEVAVQGAMDLAKQTVQSGGEVMSSAFGALGSGPEAATSTIGAVIPP